MKKKLQKLVLNVAQLKSQIKIMN